MESFWEILAAGAPILLVGLGIYITIFAVDTWNKKWMVGILFVIIGGITYYATWQVSHSTGLTMKRTVDEMTGGDSLCYIMARLVIPRRQPPESHLYVMNYGATPCFNYSAAFRLIPALDDPIDVQLKKGTTNVLVLVLDTVLPGVSDLGIPSEAGEWNVIISARNGQFLERLCVLPVDGVLSTVILDVDRGIYAVGQPRPGPEYHMRRPPEAKECATEKRKSGASQPAAQ